MSLLASSIVDIWLSKIRLAKRHKKEQFQDMADVATRFYNGPHNFQFTPAILHNEKLGFTHANTMMDDGPPFQITVNKTFELVRLFLPYLYHRVPKRRVKPKIYQFKPMLQQMLQYQDAQMPQKEVSAQLLEWVIQNTANEMDLREDSRYAVSEALIKGAGVMWHELHPVGDTGLVLPASAAESIDMLQIDPDVNHYKNAKWSVREHIDPVWRVEKKFGMDEGSLKPNMTSMGDQSLASSFEEHNYYEKETEGNSCDLMVWYEVFSRMGLGDKLQGAPQSMKGVLSAFGDNVRIVVAPGVPYPLNLPVHLFTEANATAEIASRIKWPTENHQDPTDPWPWSWLKFHTVHNQLWPMSHLAPALGEQIFLNWAYSMLAGKIHTTSRDFIAYAQSAEEEVVDAIMNGQNLTGIPINDMFEGSINNVVDFLQHPKMNSDIFQVLQLIETNFEKRTGLNELMYAMRGSQMRSGTEAQMMRDSMTITPQDMAQEVDNWSNKVAKKEAILAQSHLTPNDVSYIFGEDVQEIQIGPTGMQQFGPLTQMWQQFLAGKEMKHVVADFAFSIEESSGQAQDASKEKEDINQALQYMAPMLTTVWEGTGDPSGLNALLTRWHQVMEFEEPAIIVPDMRQQIQQQQQVDQQEQLQDSGAKS
jgi:hypothetical protein